MVATTARMKAALMAELKVDTMVAMKAVCSVEQMVASKDRSTVEMKAE